MSTSVEINLVDKEHIQVTIGTTTILLDETQLAQLLFELSVASIELKEMHYA